MADLEDDIVQDKIPQHLTGGYDEFSPWHKVRKQFIRKHQWNKTTTRMAQRYWKHDLAPLRCMLIPGDDLLDIRSLRQAFEGLQCPIRYLGFNSSYGSGDEGTKVHLAHNAVISYENIDKESIVVRDRFEAVASTESQAFRYLREHGPFHAVVLDFCGSIFPNVVTDNSQTYEAIHQLIAFQCRRQTREWILFLTTQVEPGVVDVNGLQKLCAATASNLMEHCEFAAALCQVCPTVQVGADTKLELTRLSHDETISIFGVALGKWLLKLCQTADPKWSVELRPSFQYCIHAGKGVEMLSLAFEFTPNFVAPIDPSGISKITFPRRVFPSEKLCAQNIVRSVGSIKNVDSLLESSPELWASLLQEKADLMEAAGYSRSKFMEWVNRGES